MHAYMLDALKQIGCAFVGAGVTITMIQIGNLGEFVAYCVGYKNAFSSYRCYAANAYEPLNTISRSGIDLIWVRFAKDEADDLVLLQEVKTTGDSDMAIHAGLVADHRKMFGRTSRETLSIMLQAVKSRLVFDEGRPDLCSRLTRLAGVSPQTCKNVMLHPTIVHEKIGSDPHPVMLAVRTSIAALGWTESVILPWSVSISQLMSRLQRLAEGK
jgi:hypothetical protein